MKLLNINAWGGQKLEELLKLLSIQDWDLITIQEVFALDTDSKEPVYKGEKVMNLLNIIKQELKQQHFFFSSTAGYVFESQRVEYGNLTISKRPMRDTRTIFFDIDYDGNFKSTDGDYTKDPRNVQVVDVQLEDYVIRVMNTHGIWQLDKKKSDTDRTIEMTQIIKDQISEHLPTIIAGDFNLTPDTKSIKQLEEKMSNLVIENGFDNTRNKFKGVVEVVDYVFTNKHVSVNKFEVKETEASDHNALILDFDVTK